MLDFSRRTSWTKWSNGAVAFSSAMRSATAPSRAAR